MIRFLDTNICIYFLKGVHPQIRTRLLNLGPEDVKIPSIVMAELFYGAAKSERKQENRDRISQFLEPLEIVPFDEASALCYADIRSQTERKGTPVGPNDLVIAATVISQDGILITNNLREFQRISQLAIENWLA